MSRDARNRPLAEPSEGEWDLLEAVWELEPITAREVTEAVHARRAWAYSTVKTMLDRMVDKSLLSSTKIGSVYQYSAAVARDDVARVTWRRLVDRVFGGSPLPALRFAASATNISEAQRAQLERLLAGDESDEEPEA